MEEERRRELILTEPQREQLLGWIRQAYPAEGCGLLVGHVVGDRHLVERVIVTENRAGDRAGSFYEIDPRALLAASQAARVDGLELLGIWHSHPDRAARPSRLDLLRAWGMLSYLIASVTAGGVGELRSWRLADGETESGSGAGRAFVEERLRVDAGPGVVRTLRGGP